ncbi:MAG: hypothetical protein COB42_06780 [Sulfurimonas sp.]|nr:MAG: hypothetical protein COB42_06780 [Sulfurimonas sp.]
MAKKNKFDILNDKILENVQEGAPLKEVSQEPKKQNKNFMVYSIDKELADAISASPEKLSGFAKRAMRKLAREEGII